MSDDLKIQACFSDVYHKLYDELSIQQFYKLRKFWKYHQLFTNPIISKQTNIIVKD